MVFFGMKPATDSFVRPSAGLFLRLDADSDGAISEEDLGGGCPSRSRRWWVKASAKSPAFAKPKGLSKKPFGDDALLFWAFWEANESFGDSLGFWPMTIWGICSEAHKVSKEVSQNLGFLMVLDDFWMLLG